MALPLGGLEGTIPTNTVLIVLVGMVVLAGVDIWRQEVEDYATGALLVAAVGGLLVEGVSASQWVSGLISASLGFLVYLMLGTRGVMGGGDVKLSVVPTLVLGAAHPLLGAGLGLMWVSCALIVQQLLFWATRLIAPVPGSAADLPALPHVPAMAVAMLALSYVAI